MSATATTILVAIILITGCGRAQTQNAGGQAVTEAPKTIEAVLAAHNDSLMAVPGVLATAIGRCNGAPCIKILVSRVTDDVQRRVPRQLEGFPVQVDVSGPIVPR
jgi:hypothetical protein